MSKESGPGVERESPKLKYQREANLRLQNLVRNGAPLRQVAQLLNAEEFLTTQRTSSKSQPVTHFNAAKFIEREVAKGTFLEPPEQYSIMPDVVIPPDSGELVFGSGNRWEKRKIIPRSRYMVEILTELREPYQVFEGTNAKGMMRALSYKIFVIPGMGRIGMVNDEEGNATFVINSFAKHEGWDSYAAKTKDELKSLPEVITINYPGTPEEWKKEVRIALTTQIQNQEPERKNSEWSLKKEAPLGWQSINQLIYITGHNIGVLPSYIKQQWSRLRHEFPSDFILIENKTEYCSPRIVSMILPEHETIRHQSKDEEPPSDWISFETLIKELGSTNLTLKKVAAEFKENYPTRYYRRRKSFQAYCPPGLAKIIRDRLQESAPLRKIRGMSNDATARTEGLSIENILRKQPSDLDLSDIEKVALAHASLKEVVNVLNQRFQTDEKGLDVHSPATQVLVFVLHDYLGWTFSRIAKILGKHETAANEVWKKMKSNISTSESLKKDLIDILKEIANSRLKK